MEDCLGEEGFGRGRGPRAREWVRGVQGDLEICSEPQPVSEPSFAV